MNSHDIFINQRFRIDRIDFRDIPGIDSKKMGKGRDAQYVINK